MVLQGWRIPYNPIDPMSKKTTKAAKARPTTRPVRTIVKQAVTPYALNYGVQLPPLEVHSVGPGRVRVKASVLAAILTSAPGPIEGGIVYSEPLSPEIGYPSQLSLMSEMYEKYWMKSIVWKYIPTCNANAFGNLVSWISPDPDELVTTGTIGVMAALTTASAQTFSVREPSTIRWKSPDKEFRWTRQGSSDGRLAFEGKLVIQNVVPSTASIGLGLLVAEIELEYCEPHIDMLEPTIPELSGEMGQTVLPGMSTSYMPAQPGMSGFVAQEAIPDIPGLLSWDPLKQITHATEVVTGWLKSPPGKWLFKIASRFAPVPSWTSAASFVTGGPAAYDVDGNQLTATQIEYIETSNIGTGTYGDVGYVAEYVVESTKDFYHNVVGKFSVTQAALATKTLEMFFTVLPLAFSNSDGAITVDRTLHVKLLRRATRARAARALAKKAASSLTAEVTQLSV